MNIRILDPRGKEWQSTCAPIQRESTAQKGGLIVRLEAESDVEGLLLRFLPLELRDKMPPLTQSRCSMNDIYTEMSSDYSQTKLLCYQVASPSGDLGHCYEMAGAITSIIGKVHEKYSTPVVA
jgi:hypothetical protein